MKSRVNFKSIAFSLLAITLLAGVVPAEAQQKPLDGTLKTIKSTATLNLGYLESAPPFSFTGPDKRPAGYSVDLCTRVASGIQKQLDVNLKLRGFDSGNYWFSDPVTTDALYDAMARPQTLERNVPPGIFVSVSSRRRK